jgi:hypothetical protein
MACGCFDHTTIYIVLSSSKNKTKNTPCDCFSRKLSFVTITDQRKHEGKYYLLWRFLVDWNVARHLIGKQNPTAVIFGVGHMEVHHTRHACQ